MNGAPMIGQGRVKRIPLRGMGSTDPPKVDFGSDGLPTPASYAALEKAVASAEGVDPSTVRMNYFKTSDAETAALDAWIKQQQADPGPYRFCTRNCAVFTAQGLVAAGVINQSKAKALSIDPNRMFWQLGPISNDNQPREKVTSRIIPGSIKPVDQ